MFGNYLQQTTSADDIFRFSISWRFKGTFLFSGFPRALEIMENLENQKKSSMHGKIMEIEKTWMIMEKSWNFVK